MSAPDRIHLAHGFPGIEHDGVEWGIPPDTRRGDPLYIRVDLCLHGETLDAVRAAIRRQIENIERWRETGVAAGPDESREIYEGLCAAVACIQGDHG